MRPNPIEVVKKNFESRSKLVEQLVQSADRLLGDTTEQQVKSRLMALSNAKLLRLYKVEQAVRERFGDRAKLVAHIITQRKTAGLTHDANFEKKLETFSKARLLDLTREKHDQRPAKQTPEQKLRSKHGRKERERALAKVQKS